MDFLWYHLFFFLFTYFDLRFASLTSSSIELNLILEHTSPIWDHCIALSRLEQTLSRPKLENLNKPGNQKSIFYGKFEYYESILSIFRKQNLKHWLPTAEIKRLLGTEAVRQSFFRKPINNYYPRYVLEYTLFK